MAALMILPVKITAGIFKTVRSWAYLLILVPVLASEIIRFMDVKQKLSSFRLSDDKKTLTFYGKTEQ